jgi:hypothetical protein
VDLREHGGLGPVVALQRLDRVAGRALLTAVVLPELMVLGLPVLLGLDVALVRGLLRRLVAGALGEAVARLPSLAYAVRGCGEGPGTIPHLVGFAVHLLSRLGERLARGLGGLTPEPVVGADAAGLLLQLVRQAPEELLAPGPLAAGTLEGRVVRAGDVGRQ